MAGSARAGSFNTKLAHAAGRGASATGAEVTHVNLRDLALPLFDEDLEASQGLPAGVKHLQALMRDHHGFIIASPEYNSSLTPMLKNAIDWASRGDPPHAPLASFTGKVAALYAASAGALGGLRGLVHLRAILGNINVLVLPQQYALSRAHEAFDADGSLKDAKVRATVEAIAADLTRTIVKLRG
ncbi:MAG: FMN reductase [Phycisphaerae bacterium]|nr:MAG: FMN reductase [Phycisphaerae bacterium]